jgi:hypothetical protein
MLISDFWIDASFVFCVMPVKTICTGIRQKKTIVQVQRNTLITAVIVS